jgi:vacuolar-type H+-ATPase subunit E/Vma4
MDQHPEIIKTVEQILRDELRNCDHTQLETFARYSVEPYLAPILRYGKTEKVVVVARKANEVIYWEEVEEGFNVSLVGADGTILEHWCNQDDLALALSVWNDGRERPPKVGPAGQT